MISLFDAVRRRRYRDSAWRTISSRCPFRRALLSTTGTEGLWFLGLALAVLVDLAGHAGSFSICESLAVAYMTVTQPSMQAPRTTWKAQWRSAPRMASRSTWKTAGTLSIFCSSRRSVGALQDPAPDGRDLELILDLGLRAPDHGRLRPWRFVLIRGEARTAFADRLVAAARRRDPDAPQALLDRYRAWPLRTPC